MASRSLSHTPPQKLAAHFGVGICSTPGKDLCGFVIILQSIKKEGHKDMSTMKVHTQWLRLPDWQLPFSFMVLLEYLSPWSSRTVTRVLALDLMSHPQENCIFRCLPGHWVLVSQDFCCRSWCIIFRLVCSLQCLPFSFHNKFCWKHCFLFTSSLISMWFRNSLFAN